MTKNINRIFFPAVFPVALLWYLLILLLSGCLFESREDKNLEVEGPPNFRPQAVPKDNPTTKKGVELGRMLFYDPILSGDSTQACASCHSQSHAFSDNGKQFSEGITGEVGNMNAPALVNPGWNESNFWNGRAPTLEDQALGPVKNPIEMNSKWTDVVNKLKSHPTYPPLFDEVFGTQDIDSMHVVKAIAQFERTLVSKNTKFDKVARDEAEWTPEEGEALEMMLNGKIGDCFHCHDQPHWGDGQFRNIGLDSTFDPNSGRAAVTGITEDAGAWKTPTLRNLVFTAPYMHDGRFETLEEVLDHYNTGVVNTGNTHELVMKRLEGSHEQIPLMTEEQMQKIIFFLKCCLTDSSYVTDPRYGNPFLE